jgi:2-succinyl-6-hydroxy-2,4-cyclohexadiene-1-carboxylate synthase
VTIVRANGIDFRAEVRDSGDPLVLLHGFTGSADSWAPHIDGLARDHRVIAIDLIGHGESDAPPDPRRYAFAQALDDLAAIADHLNIKEATWLGYSMGGRLALGFALRHPYRVQKLILENATPGIANQQERDERRTADEELAQRIERDGIASFVTEWEHNPIFASQRSLPAEVVHQQHELRLRNRPIGLANSLRGMGQGAQPSFWGRLHEIQMPTLLIAGTCDPKFAAIATRMHALIPQSTLALIPDAGHAVHLERPRQFDDVVKQFLMRHGSRTASQQEFAQ